MGYMQELNQFKEHLQIQEKSDATVEKYLRDAAAFLRFAGDRELSQEVAVEYKKQLQQYYTLRSVNSMLASINSYFSFLGREDCRLRNLRCQQQIYCPEENELTKQEYIRLLRAARSNRKLYLILQTICATGIRVSELPYFTVEALHAGSITVRCKSKSRTVLVPGKLKSQLLAYGKEMGIVSGPVFVSREGKPVNRSQIWRQMKQLCRAAMVSRSKVFPHNLRKLFAKTFYAMEKDIAKLADLLGHSSINTTRIYIMSTGTDHLRKMERLGLIFSPGKIKRVT